MNARELMHQWAHQTRPHRKSGNVSYDGPALYSYRACIAYLHTKHAHKRPGETGLDTGARSRFVLVSERRYSVTTAKHIKYAQSAVSHLPAATVPHVRPIGRNEHRANFDFIVGEAARMLKEAQRVQRAHGVAWRVNEARGYLRQAADYSAFFGLRWKAPAFPQLEWTNAQIRAERIENPNPASLDKRERKRAERAERKAERERQAAAQANIRIMAARTNWRLFNAFGDSGLPAYGSYRMSRDNPVMLRVNGDTIETSLGARVPVAAAPMVWALVERHRRDWPEGRQFRTQGLARKFMVGDYPIDEIEGDGTLHAGCHTIPYSELRAMARTLGLIERGQ